MDSGKAYRDGAFAQAPALAENDYWRRVDPRDVSRIACDRSHMCAEQATWASRSVLPCSYVCDYHRRVFDLTGTFWKGDSE